MANGAQYMRRELMIRLVRAFDKGILKSELDQIPIKLRPRNSESTRCCIYHDRAVLRYRLMALLGFSCEEEGDETRRLDDYLTEAEQRTEIQDNPPLTICSAGCSRCPDSSYVVTGNCRGCFARPCVFNCPQNAIAVINQVSRIDYSKCIKCGKCMTACPYHAIVKTTVPCEEACPTGAIRKNEQGRAVIDFDKCIYCGKCFSRCPFSAIMERSQLLDVMNSLKEQQQPVVAMIAPSAYLQFPGTIEQLFSAVEKLGFTDVVEVALGAELTTAHEAEEFQERMRKGEKLMTTSCCSSYVELVKRHLPDFVAQVSTTPSPMRYTVQITKKRYPDAKTVFIGPCIAKRLEALQTKEVDYVLTFEELGALLAGRNIDVITQPPRHLEKPATKNARDFAKSCGVTQAVLADLMKEDPNFKLDSKFIDGIDKKTLIMLKMYKLGKLPANFLEVMACSGGCINGPCSLTKD